MYAWLYALYAWFCTFLCRNQNHTFLNKWAIPGLFYKIICEKMFMRFWVWDSNPLLLELESPAITTRSGLPPRTPYSYIPKFFSVISSRISAMCHPCPTSLTQITTNRSITN